MADGDDRLTLETVAQIAAVPAEDWDACAGADNPFVGHAFLKALEDSKSVGREAGWLSQHAVTRDATGRIVAVVPMYLKGHSYGEYVFDHGWADAYMRAGGRYYPKLQVAVPFTPASGPRILVRGDAREGTREAVIATLPQIAQRMRVSSLHATFCTAQDSDGFAAAGYLIRQGLQFHWENHGYRSFDDYLATLSHSRRKSVRRERRAVAEQGITLEILTGADLKPAHWDAFFEFYIATSERKWGDPYLTREFFDILGATMADRVALVIARKDGRAIGGALNLVGADTIYGRNWGCRGDYPFLHFEACYYQAIEFAIGRGLSRVEAGAQGEHKLQRGYLPVATWSAHWIADPGLREAIARFLERERPAIAAHIAELGECSPYRRGPEPAESEAAR
jgi:hypothetical protein